MAVDSTAAALLWIAQKQRGFRRRPSHNPSGWEKAITKCGKFQEIGLRLDPKHVIHISSRDAKSGLESKVAGVESFSCIKGKFSLEFKLKHAGAPRILTFTVSSRVKRGIAVAPKGLG